MPTLPALIFSDPGHLNVSSYGFLIKLAPKLKELGYDNFYTQLPSSLKQENIIKEVKATIAATNASIVDIRCLKNEIKDMLEPYEHNYLSMTYDILSIKLSLKLNEVEGSLRYQNIALVLYFLDTAKQNLGVDKLDRNNILSLLGSYIDSMEKKANEMTGTMLELFNTLLANKIQCKGIEDPNFCTNVKTCVSFNSSSTIKNAAETVDSLTAESTVNKRNKLIANAYIEAPALSLAHFPPTKSRAHSK